MGGSDKIAPLVICGPTASGKTSLSVELAKMLDGEVVSADSMQIYKGLSIGTAKPSKIEMQGIPHHLIDFKQPDEIFSVSAYTQLAHNAIVDIAKRGKTPIVCGGTGQYISSLIEGLSFIGEKPKDSYRQALASRATEEGIMPIYHELCAIDASYAKALHPNNKIRVLRAMELYLQTGKTMTQQINESKPKERPYNELVICLAFSNRADLYNRINLRVDNMLEQGLILEAKHVYDKSSSFVTAAQAIGYKEFFLYFEQKQSLEECIDKLKQASRNYAKRQLTWFKRINSIKWLDAQSNTLCRDAKELWENHNGRAKEKKTS